MVVVLSTFSMMSGLGGAFAMNMSRRLHHQSGGWGGNLIFLGVGAFMFAAALAAMFLF